MRHSWDISNDMQSEANMLHEAIGKMRSADEAWEQWNRVCGSLQRMQAYAIEMTQALLEGH